MRQKDLLLESYKLMFLEFSWIPRQNEKIDSLLEQTKLDFKIITQKQKEEREKERKENKEKEKKESNDHNMKNGSDFLDQSNQLELVKYKTQFFQKFIQMFRKHKGIINFLKIIKTFLDDDIAETNRIIKKLKEK